LVCGDAQNMVKNSTDNEEELKSKRRAVELFESSKIMEIPVGTTRGLQEIHHFLFQDVFDFAGKILPSGQDLWGHLLP
jgi:fido (protein-threonine AMPylation protein)